jgi:hypothetical protein
MLQTRFREIGIEQTKNSPPSFIFISPHSSAQQNILLADITTAALAREQAVTGGTHDDKSRAWRRWTTYCDSISMHGTYMDDLDQQD